MNHPIRDVRSWRVPRALPEVIQGLLAADLLDPPGRMWLVSPWVSDIAVLDNSAGEFAVLAPDWDHSGVRLSLVLAQLVRCGTRLVTAVRADGRSEAFLDALRSSTGTLWEDHLMVCRSDSLHEKGLLSDRYYLRGSFNFTRSGVWANEESAVLTTAPDEIAEARMAFASRWEGYAE